MVRRQSKGKGKSKLWGREGERSQSNSLSALSWRVREGPPKLGNQCEFKGQEFQHTNSKFCIHWKWSPIFSKLIPLMDFFFLQGSFYFCFCFGFGGNQGKKCDHHHATEEKTWCGNRNTQKRQVWAHRSPWEFLLSRLQSTARLGLGVQTHLRSQGTGKEFALLIA